MRRAALSAALAFALSGAASAQPTPAAHMVAIELREDGRLVAASQVRLRLGRPAAIAVTGPYAVRLRVDERAGGGFTVRPNLHVDGPGGWAQVPTPTMSMAAGERARTRIDRAAGPALELAVSVD